MSQKGADKDDKKEDDVPRLRVLFLVPLNVGLRAFPDIQGLRWTTKADVKLGKTLDTFLNKNFRDMYRHVMRVISG